GVDRLDLHRRQFQKVHVPIHVRRVARLDLADLVASNLTAAALRDGTNRLAPRLDLSVNRGKLPECKDHLYAACLVLREDVLQTRECATGALTSEPCFVE